MKRCLVLLLSFIFSLNIFAQTAARPKVVVGIVVDQMRWDFLYRYKDRYSEGGFRRLLKEGFSYDNNFIPYTPTYTAVGHTCLYTGSVPAVAGIVGNNWYDRATGKSMYCTSDSTVAGVGGKGFFAQMSPKNLWANTIGDELRLATNFNSRTFGISLKDRGSILPAGHTANAAYWYQDGNWITSTYYMNALPAWVSAFNEKDFAGKALEKPWNTLYPIATYKSSSADSATFEGTIPGLLKTTFPHEVNNITAGKYESFRYTPYANTFVVDFAKQLIENERLGSNGATDFLAVSFSTPDYIGHTFGPNSIEIEDTYLRLDRDIASFLTFLDGKYGKGNYLMFLSADHGVAHTAGFLNEKKQPAGTFSELRLADTLNKILMPLTPSKQAVLSVMNYQVYLDTSLLGFKYPEAYQRVRKYLLSQEAIASVIDLSEVDRANIPENLSKAIKNGYNHRRSGDIQFVLKPGFFDGGSRGTTHGLWNPYDSHIPMVLFGWNIKPGRSYRTTYMTDIAPTIAAMLHIQMPNGCVGNVLTEAVQDVSK